MGKTWMIWKSFLSAVFGLSFVFIFSCGDKGQDSKVVIKPLINISQQDGKTIASSGDELSSLIQKGDFEKIRTRICGKDGCSDELQTYKNELTFNSIIILTNIMILFKKLDGALTTLCGFQRIEPICPSSAGSSPAIRIDTKQTDVIDTLLGLVGLKREEITTLMQEVETATSNYIGKGDKNFVMKVTVPLTVKIGGLVDVRFKAGTEIRWDLVTVLGAVSQLVSALFSFINAHDWMLNIEPIIQNASVILGDLRSDLPGFLRRLPGMLGIDKAHNFLRFAQGGETHWKAIPSKLSTALNWAGDALDYFFKNPCAQNDPNLVCWDKGKIVLRFNLDPQYGNKFMGKTATGEMELPKGFSDKTAEQIVAVLKNGGQKFDCQQQNNWINIVGANDEEFDVIKIVNAVLSLFQGTITEVAGIPNFLRIDVCKLMGVKGESPVPVRDLIFPAELNWSDGKWVYAQAGTQFALEFEAPRNFYLKAVTAGNIENNKLYAKEVTEDPSNFFVLTNKFYDDNLTNSLPFVKSITYAGSATEFYAEVITQYGNIRIWKLYVAQDVGWKRFDFDKFKRFVSGYIDGEILGYIVGELLVGKISPLIPDKSLGVPDMSLALIVYKDWVRKSYVARGDGDRFRKVFKGDQELKVARDWIEPLTTYVTKLTYWFSNYPDDVMPASLDEIFGIGLKNITYVLFKDKGGLVLNGAVQIDNCSIIIEYAKTLSAAVQGNKIDKDTYGNYKNFILLPFVVERVAGYTYESFIRSNFGQNQSELQPISPSVKYMEGCELNISKFGGDSVPDQFSQLSHPQPQWVGATNQIVNDLISLLTFGLRARSLIK